MSVLLLRVLRAFVWLIVVFCCCSSIFLLLYVPSIIIFINIIIGFIIDVIPSILINCDCLYHGMYFYYHPSCCMIVESILNLFDLNVATGRVDCEINTEFDYSNAATALIVELINSATSYSPTTTPILIVESILMRLDRTSFAGRGLYHTYLPSFYRSMRQLSN